MKKYIVRQVERLSKSFRGMLRAGAILFGIRRYENGQVNFNQLVMAGGSFLAGVPIGLLLFEGFSLTLWAIVVLVSLVLSNLDQSILYISILLDFGIENEQEFI